MNTNTYLTVAEVAREWDVSERRVRTLCQSGRIEGAVRREKTWLIPSDTLKPTDKRSLRYVSIPLSLTEVIYTIDALKDELAKLRPLTMGEMERMREAFVVDYTHASNAIEGNTLTWQETALVLQGVTIDQKPLKDHLEAIGHRDAFNFLESIIKREEPLSERTVKEIHSLVLMDRPEDKGVYRRIPVMILGAANTPSQPYLIQPQMEKLFDEYKKSKLHPVVKAGYFHLLFESIHPFIDGNGRTGRLLVNFMLMQAGYPPISIKFENRHKYYDAFKVYHETGAIEPMAGLVAHYVEERLSFLREILK